MPQLRRRETGQVCDFAQDISMISVDYSQKRWWTYRRAQENLSDNRPLRFGSNILPLLRFHA